MTDPCEVINLRAEVVSTGAESVQWCPTCHCPVVVADGALERHGRRCHTSPTAAPAGINVQRWERPW
jgi:hypothetical protein